MILQKWLGFRRPSTEVIPQGWSVMRLGDVSTTKGGGRIGLTESDYKAEGFPSFCAGGQNGFVDVAEYEGEAVILSSIGEQCGKAFYAEGKWTTLVNVQAIFPDLTKANCYYLWNLLNDRDFWPRAQTAQPYIRPSDIRKSWVVLPPKEEQDQIALLLRSVDDAIAKAKAELEATRELKRSLMQTLFVSGMPGRHSEFVETKIGRVPKGWQVIRVKDVLIDKPINGYSPQSNPEPPGTKTLNVACIRHGECDIAKATYVDIDDSVIEALQVMPGDFFVLRGNGNRNYIGIGGIVRDDIREPMIYSDLLFRLRFKDSESVPLYIPYMWQSLTFLHRLQAKAKSGSGLWKIGKRDIEKELLALPGKDEQQEIVDVIESVIESYVAVEQKVEALQQVKKSLLQNLLTGKIRIPPGVILSEHPQGE